MSKTDTDQAEQYEKQREHSLHTTNLSENPRQEGNDDAGEILRILSDIDDLPISPEDDPVMGQLVSRLTSTANLTPEQVRSNEWVHEIILLLYQCKFPRPGGLDPWFRGYAFGDPSAERDVMDAEERMLLETHTSMSKIALSRSENAKVMEEGSRTINESVVDSRDGDGGSGGLRGRFGL